ncbi:MAG: hypothetical protein Q9165_003888 [Trypethelium subeluteriae]
MIDYLDSLPSVREAWPYIDGCAFEGGQGAPSVHIAVNELTDTQRATVTVDRNAPGIYTSIPPVIPATPPPAPTPSSVNQPQPAPVTKPAMEPTPTAAQGFTGPATEGDKPSNGGTKGSGTSAAGFQGIHDGASNSNGNSVGAGNSGLTETGNVMSANGENDSGTSKGQDPQQEGSRLGDGGTLASKGSGSAGDIDTGNANGGSHFVASDHASDKHTASPNGEEGSNNRQSESRTSAGAEAAKGYLNLLATGSGSDEQGSGTSSATPNSRSSSLRLGSDSNVGSSSRGGDSGTGAARTDILSSAILGSNVILPVGRNGHISAVIVSPGGIILPNSQTLAAGHATTYDGVSISLSPNQGAAATPSEVEATIISGTTISLAPGETAVVVNGKTEALNPPVTTPGIGDYVASGIGASGTSEGSNTNLEGAPGSTAQAAGSGAKSAGDRNNIWATLAISTLALLVLV